MKIVTLQEAKDQKLVRYFTGNPCKNGHVAERYVSNKRCLECDRLNSKHNSQKYRMRNHDQLLQRNRDYYANNKEDINNVGKEARKNNPRVIEKRVRQEARDQGLQTYETTIPCEHGHKIRRSSDGTCVACRQANWTRYSQSEHGHKMQLLRAARKRAKEHNVPFEITIDDIIINDICPILGIPLERGNQKNFAYNSPSLDKIIPDLGYVPGNIQVISSKANRMKSDGTKEDIIALYEWAIKSL